LPDLCLGTFSTPVQHAVVDRLRVFFDYNVPFDNTNRIYLISLLWKLGLGLGLDLQLHCFSIFQGE